VLHLRTLNPHGWGCVGVKENTTSVILVVCAFGALQAGVGVKGASVTSLKPIDRAALQNAVDTTAKELMVPGVATDRW
jgi:hypothetical protein